MFLIVVFVFVLVGVVGGQELEEKCANYTRDGTSTEHCAVCGDVFCDDFERCVSSFQSCDYSQEPPLCTASWDCGTLYCPEDCPEESCVGEGESIPVIAEPLECCEGLELIPPKVEGLVGSMGICTANCVFLWLKNYIHQIITIFILW